MQDRGRCATITWAIAGGSAHLPSNRRQIDEIDIKLLAELQEDARVSNAELGRRVGLSAPAVAERIARLQECGAITGFHAAVDPRALGLALSAILRIRPAPRELPKVAQLARDTPEVVECHRITGEDCFFVKLHVRDVEHLEEVIDEFAFFGQTTTSVMQTSPVPRRAVNAPPNARR
jgi:Lrp/AsnC family transcriptional regulator, leucine-responsive regulatory protein